MSRKPLRLTGDLSEKVITKQIIGWLKWNGFFVWKQWQGPMSRPGVSDILGVLPGGRFLAIEVKTRRGRLTKRQEGFLSAVNQKGGLGFVARSLDDVVEVLEGYQKGRTHGGNGKHL